MEPFCAPYNLGNQNCDILNHKKMLRQVVFGLLFVATALACSAGSTANSQNLCYRLYTTPMAWMDAETFCNSKGGHLASIHNQFDNNIVNKMATVCPYYYIGGVCNHSKCHWVDQSTFNYWNWQKGEPGSLYYLSVDSNNGQWRTADGTFKECFICETSQ